MQQIEQIQTPALVLNLDAVERNLSKMADECRMAGIALRPHTKGHKSPYLANRQRSLGAAGICTAKVGEAEVMAAAGIDDILITTTVSPPKVDRIVALASIAKIACVLDSADAASELGAKATARGVEVTVLVDVNVGQERTGVEVRDCASLAKRVAGTSGLRFAGIQGYEGHLQHMHSATARRDAARSAYDRLAEARHAIESIGLPVSWVTTAGTGTYRFAIEHGVATEVQPGSYPVMDCKYLQVDRLPFEAALFVLTSVVSTNRVGKLIVDAGWKALSTEDGMPVVRDAPNAAYEPEGDEHGSVSGLSTQLRLGDQIWLVPSHCDTTTNLHDRYVVIRDDGTIDGVLPIAGRGQIT